MTTCALTVASVIPSLKSADVVAILLVRRLFFPFFFALDVKKCAKYGQKSASSLSALICFCAFLHIYIQGRYSECIMDLTFSNYFLIKSEIIKFASELIDIFFVQVGRCLGKK